MRRMATTLAIILAASLCLGLCPTQRLSAQMSAMDFEYGGIIQAIEEQISELRKAAVDEDKDVFAEKLEQLSQLLKELKDRKQAADEAKDEVHVNEIVTKEGHTFRLTSKGGKVITTEVVSDQPEEILEEAPSIDTEATIIDTTVLSEVPIDIVSEPEVRRTTRVTPSRRRPPTRLQPSPRTPTTRTTTVRRTVPRVQRTTTYYLAGKEQELENRMLAHGESGLVALMRFEKVKLFRDLRMHDEAAAELKKIIAEGIPDDAVREAARWTLVEILQEQNRKEEAIAELEGIVASPCSPKTKMDALYGIINLSGEDPETKIEAIDGLIRQLQQSDRRSPYDRSFMPGGLPTPGAPTPPPGMPEPTPMGPASTVPELPREPSMLTPPGATYLVPAPTAPEPPATLPTFTLPAAAVRVPPPSAIAPAGPDAAPPLVPAPAIVPTMPSPAPLSR